MKFVFGVVLLVVAVAANGVTPDKRTDKASESKEFCFTKTKDSCTNKEVIGKCSADFGGFSSSVNTLLNNYLCEHIGLSYKYLRLATNFNSYRKDRGGLYKLYRSLSDEAWEDSIKLAKYITKRGGKIDVSACQGLWKKSKNAEVADTISMTEIGTLTSALDWHKKLATDAHTIHKHVSVLHSDDKKHYDPEVSSFIEKNYVHEHAEKIRQLTGHVNDLAGLANSDDAGLGYYLFDEHLKKLL